jgi:hypothetical protein
LVVVTDRVFVDGEVEVVVVGDGALLVATGITAVATKVLVGEEVDGVVVTALLLGAGVPVTIMVFVDGGVVAVAVGAPSGAAGVPADATTVLVDEEVVVAAHMVRITS